MPVFWYCSRMDLTLSAILYLYELDQSNIKVMLTIWAGAAQSSLTRFEIVQKRLLGLVKNHFPPCDPQPTGVTSKIYRFFHGLSLHYPYFHDNYSNESHSFLSPV